MLALKSSSYRCRIDQKKRSDPNCHADYCFLHAAACNRHVKHLVDSWPCQWVRVVYPLQLSL